MRRKKISRKLTAAKKRRNAKMLKDDSPLNIWNGYGFVMCGQGEKSKAAAKIKHILKCLKSSRQRATRGYSDMDAWNMFHYLQELIPAMLQYLRDHRHGSPYLEGVPENELKEKWDEILDRMIFLWREASEETCSKKNRYEAKYWSCHREFEKKYGLFGCKLMTEEEKKANRAGKGTTAHFMDELPEYRLISKRYFQAEERLRRYRDECKNEAMEMLKKYFWTLWD